MQSNSRLIKEVAEIYGRLDSQIKNNDKAGRCDACGRCCDFGNFDHRLFVTPPEVIYLAASLGKQNLEPMPTNICPYNIDGKCSVYEYRFASCRIFCCNGDKEFQSELSESVLKKFKSICEEFGIDYRYTDLATALNNFAGV